MGDPGTPGTPGQPGTSAVVDVLPIGPGCDDVPAGTFTWSFLDAPVPVVTTATQRVTASASFTVTSSSNQFLNFGLCWNTPSGINVIGDDHLHEIGVLGDDSLALSVTFVPGAGIWAIGPCVQNVSVFLNCTALNGWLMITGT
jgi:hypothetical protein